MTGCKNNRDFDVGFRELVLKIEATGSAASEHPKSGSR
jgi:hypothetical protein